MAPMIVSMTPVISMTLNKISCASTGTSSDHRTLAAAEYCASDSSKIQVYRRELRGVLADFAGNYSFLLNTCVVADVLLDAGAHKVR